MPNVQSTRRPLIVLQIGGASLESESFDEVFCMVWRFLLYCFGYPIHQADFNLEDRRPFVQRNLMSLLYNFRGFLLGVLREIRLFSLSGQIFCAPPHSHCLILQ